MNNDISSEMPDFSLMRNTDDTHVGFVHHETIRIFEKTKQAIDSNKNGHIFIGVLPTAPDETFEAIKTTFQTLPNFEEGMPNKEDVIMYVMMADKLYLSEFLKLADYLKGKPHKLFIKQL